MCMRVNACAGARAGGVLTDHPFPRHVRLLSRRLAAAGGSPGGPRCADEGGWFRGHPSASENAGKWRPESQVG